MIADTSTAAATREPGMSADRRAAVRIGGLYIIGIVGVTRRPTVAWDHLLAIAFVLGGLMFCVVLAR